MGVDKNLERIQYHLYLSRTLLLFKKFLPNVFFSEVLTECCNGFQNRPYYEVASALNFDVIFFPDAKSRIPLKCADSRAILDFACRFESRGVVAAYSTRRSTSCQESFEGHEKVFRCQALHELQM